MKKKKSGGQLQKEAFEQAIQKQSQEKLPQPTQPGSARVDQILSSRGLSEADALKQGYGIDRESGVVTEPRGKRK